MSMFDSGATVTTGAGATRTNPPAPRPSGPAGAASSAARQIYQLMASYLRDLGLGELATTTADGSPSGWLWQQIQGGVDSAEELRMAIESTDVWRDRFGVIVEQRKRAAKGEPVQVMSVDEVVAYERSVAQLMRQAGLPESFYDSYQDFNSLILGGLSVAEIDERLGESFNRAVNVAPEIRAAFEDFYGVGRGEAALAAYFLDPDRTLSTLAQESRTAYAAGMGERYGIGLGRDRAERIATSPMTEAGITQGFEQINRLGAVFSEGIGETSDLSAQREGVDLVFDGDSRADTAINRRIAARRAGDTSAVGGAALSREGLVGSRSV